MKAIRILLLVLIIIGVGLLLTQNLWIPSVVNFILGQGNTASLQTPVTPSVTTATSAPGTKIKPPTHTSPTPTPRPTPQPQSTGTLKGNMTIGPICPVEQIGHPCNPSPEMYAAHLVSVYSSDRSKLIVTLTPDANGNFSATLPAGTYVVDVQHQQVGSVRGAPTTVTITTGQSVSVSISIDTGIR